MNPKQIIDLAKKACHPHEKSIFASPWGEEWVLRFAESVAAAERKRMEYDGIHTCHAECQRPACVAVREAVQREREACAQIVEALKEIVDAADGTGWDQLDATFTRARAALKKARGQA
jgi:hypothetical protein